MQDPGQHVHEVPLGDGVRGGLLRPEAPRRKQHRGREKRERPSWPRGSKHTRAARISEEGASMSYGARDQDGGPAPDELGSNGNGPFLGRHIAPSGREPWTKYSIASPPRQPNVGIPAPDTGAFLLQFETVKE